MATEEPLRELKMQNRGLVPLLPSGPSSSPSSIQMMTERMMERNYLKLRSIYGIPIDSGTREQEQEAHQHVSESSGPLCEQHTDNLVPREAVIITHPSPNDVVSGKGKGIQDHKGNVRFRKILEPYLDGYDRAPRSKRRKIAAQLHQHLAQKGIRFLKEVGVNQWVEGDAEHGEVKILQLFRSLRRRDKLRTQQQGNKGSGMDFQAVKSPFVAKPTAIPQPHPKADGITPSETDVLSGRGRGLAGGSINDNPGNVNFRRFIEAHFEEFDRTDFEDRKPLVRRLIHQFAADKVRFLKELDGTGHWVTLDETEVQQKVTRLFYNIRMKKKNTAIPYQPAPMGDGITPSETDVLLVRGRGGIDDRPGNVNFRRFIEAHFEEFDRTDFEDRKPLVRRLIHQFAADKVRFLKQVDGNGHWVTLDETEVQERVFTLFYHIRKTKKKNTAIPQPAIPQPTPKVAPIIVVTPSQTDVLSGREDGKLKFHPGNVTFRSFIESYWDEFDRGATHERKILIRRLIHELAADKVRFLKQLDGTDHWVTLDETEVQKKVTYLFYYFGKNKNRSTCPKDASIIFTPSETDVLSGRGRSHIDHPGNVNFRRLIEAHWEEYDRGGIQDKRILIRRLTKQLAADKVRFLKQLDGTDHWVTLDETEVQKKASQLLQDTRKKKKVPSFQKASPSTNNFSRSGLIQPSFQRASPSTNNSILKGVII